jgi:VanZ family protein
MLQLVHRRAWFAGGLLLVLFVIAGSLLPMPELPQAPGGDKLHHFVAYAALTLWFAGMLESRRQIPVALALLVLSAAIELLQGIPTIGRSREAADLAANGTGIVLGLAAARLGLGGWCLHVEHWLGLEHGRQRSS